MTAAIAQRTTFRPTPALNDDDRFVPLAAELAGEFAARAAAHDHDNTFVEENYVRIRSSGYSRLAVPEELGGLGASMRQVCYAQAELAKGCGSTSLATTMHHYNVLGQVWRLRNGIAAAETVLRRVAEEGVIIMTSGGSDGIWPTTVAERVEGGYRVTGRKIFCSQVPTADLMTTMARYDDPDEGTIVLLMAVPTSSEGFEIVETWDTLGMRATASHDVQLTNVFVKDAQIVARRPWGRSDTALRNAAVHFAPLVAATYWGVAAGARDEAVRMIASRPSRNGVNPLDDPLLQRRVGEMDARLRTSWWSLLGALNEFGDDYKPDERTSNLSMIAKRDVVLNAIEVVDLAMETAGGPAFFRRSPIERAYRDVRAGAFHPFTPEKTLIHSGRMALDLSVDDIW
ncbi:MAG TPA: acyl-CoA dehydrogenase family protein [Thermomicrobiales bacterium]|nr:acyl-CoA dehydrogenase family protein [Thermomicrobiales bacterium]